MKIFGLGMPELIIILVVILIIFGPKNLPKLGAALGKGVKNLRDGMGAGKKKKAEEAAAAEATTDAAETTVTEQLPTVEAEVTEVEAEAAEEAPKKKVVRVVKKTAEEAAE